MSPQMLQLEEGHIPTTMPTSINPIPSFPFYSPLFPFYNLALKFDNTSQMDFAIYFNILIMSKKPQPQKENPKNKPQIVEQQNEPFLKTLQKKVRNINKKLTEIAELQVKENLKAEQVEKVNRKAALLEERARIEETAVLFKQTYVENAAVYRAIQLKELEILARAIALFHSGAKIPEGDKLASLWRALEQSDKSYPTVNESVAALSASLKDFANDRKLQKSLTAYVEEHGNTPIAPIVSNEEKIVSDVLEEKVEVKPEPVKEAVEEEPVPASVVVETPVAVVSVPEPKVEAPAPVVAAEKVEEAPKVAVEEHATPLVQPEDKEQKAAEGKGGDYKKRNYNNNRGGRGEYKGNRERREGDDQKERRQYKPKYAEKQAEEVRKEESDSSDSEPEVRNFRKEEIKELQNDGFIFVGKPKPKPKDPREQREAHDRQHGKKFHHHHHQQNQPAPPK